MIEVVGAHGVRVQIDAAEVHDPDELRGIAYDDLFGAASRREPQGGRLDPRRPARRRAFLIERRLIGAVDRLSSTESTMAFEVKLGVESPQIRSNPVYTAARHRIGVDLLALFDGEPRPDSVHDLTTRGWSTTVGTPFDFTRCHGRGPLPEPDDALASNRWVFADRSAGGRAVLELTGISPARGRPRP
jgi:hypothetical protein